MAEFQITEAQVKELARKLGEDFEPALEPHERALLSVMFTAVQSVAWGDVSLQDMEVSGEITGDNVATTSVENLRGQDFRSVREAFEGAFQLGGEFQALQIKIGTQHRARD